MQKALVVYYSLEGNTDLVAQAIADGANCPMVRLFQKDEIPATGFYRYIKGGMGVVKKSTPALKNEKIDLSEIELVFIGTPVWAGTFVPAVRTFLTENNLAGKKIACFACYAGNPGRTEQELQSFCPQSKYLGGISFKDPLKKQNPADIIRAKQWATELASD